MRGQDFLHCYSLPTNSPTRYRVLYFKRRRTRLCVMLICLEIFEMYLSGFHADVCFPGCETGERIEACECGPVDDAIFHAECSVVLQGQLQ